MTVRNPPRMSASFADGNVVATVSQTGDFVCRLFRMDKTVEEVPLSAGENSVPVSSDVVEAEVAEIHGGRDRSAVAVQVRPLPFLWRDEAGEYWLYVNRSKRIPLPGDVVEPDNLAGCLIRRGWYDFTTSPAMPELRACHYRFEDGDVYFLVNENINAPLDGTLWFRQSMGQFSLEPVSGEWMDSATGAEFSLHLAPAQSLLLFRRLQVPESVRFSYPATPTGELPVPDSWQIFISSAEDYPVFTPFPAMKKTGNLARPGLLPFFSGTIRYQCRIHVPEGKMVCGLDLGDVYETAELTVDGSYHGIRICRPYYFPVKMKPGTHELQIDVTNTLGKKCSGNLFDRGTLQDPSGLIGPVRLFTM